MKLSIIIPCLNETKHIACQLDALLCQQWSEPWEIIVCDNGSTDNSRAIVSDYITRFPNLRLVDASNRRGQAYAKNMGASLARGEFLAFIDADDVAAPGWVATIGNALMTYDFVASRLDPTMLNETWVLKARQCPQQDGLQEYKYPPYLPHAAGTGLGIKRFLHEAIGGFDEIMSPLEDTDYCWRNQLAGIKLTFFPDAIVYYRFRHTLGDIYRQSYGYAERNVLLYKKYKSLGMPSLRFSLKNYFRQWVHFLRQPVNIDCKEKQARWMWGFGWRVGRLHGSIKYRTWGL